VAYLDDGTMVVVDGARKMINKTIDISVTSVHQTTAGKMIFGRFDERGDPGSRQPSTPAPAPEASSHRTSPAGDPRAAEPTQAADRPMRPLSTDPTRS
jgi:hypothetical protein